MNKNVFVAAIMALALTGAGCQSNTNLVTDNGQNTASPTPSTTQGKVIFSITDAAANMHGVTSVQVTVDKIEMHSTTQGWVTVSNETKQFDLLALKASGKFALAAAANVAADTYNQIRLHVQKIIVVKSGVSSEAKLPSNELKINGTFTVAAGTTDSIAFDFSADESLHVTGKGEFIFAPVVKTESRADAEVSVDADDMVTVTNGRVESEDKEGMDVQGDMRANFKLEANDELEIMDGAIEHAATGTVRINSGAHLKMKGLTY